MINIKSPEEIAIIREGGRILAEIIAELEKRVKPGIATKELDKAAEDLVFKYGAKPAFKDYEGFPATICASINDEVVHGAPSARVLKEGDIFSIDCGILYKGFYTDMAITVPVGRANPEKLRLIKITKKALKRGIKKTRPGNTFGDVGNTIQRYVESQGFNVVRELSGHGIGKDLHEDPQIPNYGKRKTGSEIKEGMVFCIEPMVTAGDWHLEKTEDGHGFKTRDGSFSAHFEHTVAVIEQGCRVLTSL